MSESLTLPADLVPHAARRIDQEAKFAAFLDFDISVLAVTTARDTSEFAIQLVTQINYGPLVSKRYFATAALAGGSGDVPFVEMTEAQMVEMNLTKANAYKNFKSKTENRFYELYLRDTTTTHHWRADIARPAAEIDI